MWIERLGGTDDSVFYGFCVVVAVILVLTFINVILTCFAGDSPGHSLSFLLDASVVMICTSVLFRGIQTRWSSDLQVFRIICQVYVAITFIGYTLFTSVLCVKCWAYVSTFMAKRRCAKWLVLVIVTSLLFVSGIAVIIWEVLFTPKVFENTDLTADNPYNQSILECVDKEEDWYYNNSTNFYQFCWRVSASSYIGAITLADLIGIPFLFCVRLTPRFEWLQPKLRALQVVQVNGALCLLCGLLIWFAYQPEVEKPYRDNLMYVIIGSLQLWKLFVTQLALLIARAIHMLDVARCHSGTFYEEMESSDSHQASSTSDSQGIFTNLKAISIEGGYCCGCCVDSGGGFDSTNRLLRSREMDTIDRNQRDTAGSLYVQDLEIYAPRVFPEGPPVSNGVHEAHNPVAYMNVPEDNGTNTRHFRY